jgi:hypothetical protein
MKKNNLFLSLNEIESMSYEKIMEHRTEVIKSHKESDYGNSKECAYSEEILDYCDIRFPEKYEKTLDELVKILHIKHEDVKKFKENMISFKKNKANHFIYLI